MYQLQPTGMQKHSKLYRQVEIGRMKCL